MRIQAGALGLGAIVGILLAVLFACSTSGRANDGDPAPGSSSNPIPTSLATAWTLVWWSDSATLPDVPITLLIGNGVVGNSGCNTYSGPLSAGKDTFRVGVLSSTFVLCPDPVASAETTYRFLLQATSQWSRTGSSLTLGTDGTALLRFVLTQ